MHQGPFSRHTAFGTHPERWSPHTVPGSQRLSAAASRFRRWNTSAQLKDPVQARSNRGLIKAPLFDWCHDSLGWSVLSRGNILRRLGQPFCRSAYTVDAHREVCPPNRSSQRCCSVTI